MTRIGGASKRPRIPLTPKKTVAASNEGKPKPPEPEEQGVNMRIAGFDLAHRLSRGTDSRPWGDGHREPSTGPRDDRPCGAPDPVIPGAKGDHGGLELPPAGPRPEHLDEPEAGPSFKKVDDPDDE